MIQAVIFDCFGVLTSDGWLPFKQKYFSHDPGLEVEATDLGRQVNAGLLDYKEFVQQIADMADVPKAEAHRAVHDDAPNETLFDYISTSLKPHYKLGILSNAGRNMLEDLFSPEHLGLFDARALSYETGYMKPDRRAYQTIAERLGVPEGACVFIDDQEGYCTAAREAGMQAVTYRDFDQMRTELDRLLSQSRQ